MLAALAEFERELISERTKAGMAAAKMNGKHVGRPCKLTSVQVEKARRRIAEGEITQRDMAKVLGVGPETLRRALSKLKQSEAQG